MALQPRHLHETYVRECVTLTPPATTHLGDEHKVLQVSLDQAHYNVHAFNLFFQQVYIEMDVTNSAGVYVFLYNQKQVQFQVCGTQLT